MTFRPLETHFLYLDVTISKFQSISKIMVSRCPIRIPAILTQGLVRVQGRAEGRVWYVYGSDESG